MAVRRRQRIVRFDWKPMSKKQKKLASWWAHPKYKDYDGVIADGAVRAGKTIAIIDGFLTWSNTEFRGQNFIIAGRSMGALKRNVLEPMFAILRGQGETFTYNRSGDHYVHIHSTDNIYYLFGASTEASQDTLQGLTAAGAYADEVALFPQSFVNQMVARCSVEGAKIWMNCNPDHPLHPIKTEFIDKAKEKKFLHLHFTMDDNPTLSEKVKERYKRMFRGVFYKRYILGLWVVAEGLVYGDDYRPDLHQVPRATIEKMIKEGKFIRYVGGVDFGYSHPMVGLIAGITENGEYYLIDEFYKTKQKTEALGEFFLKWEEKLKQKLFVIFCDSAEPDRIMTLQDMGLRAKGANKEIMAGINSVQTCFSNERLFLSDHMTETDRELQMYAFPDEEDPKFNKGLPLDETNHAMDALRYLVHNYEKIFIKQRNVENRKQRKRQRSSRQRK